MLLAGAAMLTGVIMFVQRHPVWSAIIAVTLVALGALALRAAARSQAERQAYEAELARWIDTTDTMTGEQFEHWVAGVLGRSGFHRVRVCGGAGDRGADILARTPDGRRVVVQCKRQGLRNPVGSAAIQRFAGTCRSVHDGDLCMIITNGRFSNGDGLALARELDILLIDREQLAAWAAYHTPPLAVSQRIPLAAD